MKGCLILSKVFSASIEKIVVLVFAFVYVMNYVFWFVYVEPALHPWDLPMVDKLFDVLLQSACQYFIEDFCIYVHHRYWPEVLFSRWVSAGFWYQDDVGLIK